MQFPTDDLTCKFKICAKIKKTCQALDHIRQFSKDSEALNVVYAVNKSWKLMDEIRLQEILLARPNQTIADLMDNRFVSLNVLNDQKTAISVFHDYNRTAIL